MISGDIRISRNRAEKAAWRESGLTAFFFVTSYPLAACALDSLDDPPQHLLLKC